MTDPYRDEARVEARHDERKAVIAFLMKEVRGLLEDGHDAEANVVNNLAYRIGKGEHRR